MSRSVTLAQLAVRVRQRADIENKIQRFTPGEVADAINEGIAETWDELLKARGHGYYEKDVAITTIAGTSLYALDSTFLSLKNVAATIAGEPIVFLPFDLTDRAWLTNPQAGWTGAPFRYRLRAANIELLPTPSGVYTVTLTIVPTATKLYSETDSFDGIDGWEELAVCSAARKMAIKNGAWELVGTLEKDIGWAKDRIAALAPKRNEGPPNRILDVRRLDRQSRSRRFR